MKKMDKIKCFIECLVPVTACNLKCSYCYIIQENRRKNEIPKLPFPPEYITKSLSKKRLGGTAYLSFCGAGETLLSNDLIPLIDLLLQEGHYINITTNGTITNNIEKLLCIKPKLLKHLHFAFSLHYLELKRTGNLEKFFNNVNLVRNAGCSFVVQVNLCDEYLPFLDEIKKLCVKNIGAMPQVAATRDEIGSSKIKLLTNLSQKKYEEYGENFNSPLFKFTMKNFMDQRKEFCYAGEWTFTLNLMTGELKKCYFSRTLQNIYENIYEEIRHEAVGKYCKNAFCTNSTHFMALGVIPSIETPSYESLRNRREAHWYTDEMCIFLSNKLADNNKKFSKFKETFYLWIILFNRINRKIRRLFKSI